MTYLPCPDAHTWQALLEDESRQGEGSDLHQHLETCVSCQQTLELLAADSDCWVDVGRDLAAAPARPDPALRQAMEQLKLAEGQSAPGTEDAAEAVLAFLRTPKRPGLLGQLGTYDVVRVIGSGGMGVVLEAFDPALQRTVALKVLAPQLAGSATARRRFVREGRAAAAVVHEQVVTVHGVEEAGGLPWLVMQYVAGTSLQERLDHTGALPLPEALAIGAQAAAGLAAAHARGLIHRDVKPANILLEEGGRGVKLTDFGLARAIDDVDCTGNGVVAGTPEYMAPEQARAEVLDHRADLFSLGSVLYAMSTGRPPFRAATPLGVLRQIIDEAPRPPRALNPEVPDWLEEIVLRLLAKDPAQRFRSAADVAALLAQHLAHLQHPETVPQPPRLAPASRPPRRLRRWLIAAVVLILTALGVSETAGFTGIVQAAAVALRLRTPEGTLVVTVVDPNVKVTIDGEDVLITGAGVKEVRLKPGHYKLRATRDGRPLQVPEVTITEGGRETVKVTFEPAAVPAPLVGIQRPLDFVVQPPPVALAPPAPGWRPKEGKVFERPVALWGIPEHRAACGAFSPDGLTLATGLWNGAAVLWNFSTGKPEAFLRTPDGWIRGIAFSPDNKEVATATSDGFVRIWDRKTGRLQQELRGSGGANPALAYSPDGATLAAVNGRELRLWDVQTGKPRVLVPAFAAPVWSVAFAPDGKSVAVAVGLKDRGSAVLISTADGMTLRSVEGPAYVRRVAYSLDGKHLAFNYGEEGWTRIVDLSNNGKELVTFRANHGPLFSLTYIHKGRRLLTSGTDGTAALWDVAPKEVRRVATFVGEPGSVWFAAVSPDGRTLATSGAGQVIRLWDLRELGLTDAPP